MSRLQLQNRLLFPDTQSSGIEWAALLADTEAWAGTPTRFDGLRIVFVVQGMRAALAAACYGILHDLDCGVIEASRLSPEVEARFAEAGVTLITQQDGEQLILPPQFCDYQPGRVTVLTSGTTGLLKLIPHSKATLNTFDRLREVQDNYWFLPYQVGSYAWYQMVALSLFVPGQHLVPGDFADLAASFEGALRTGGLTAISSTPTFWRHALMSIDEAVLEGAALRSISLGGEIVDQAILDQLTALYPNARIRHIYASSEAGAAIVVSDGRAGFDAKLLTNMSGAIGVRVKEGRLHIRSPYGSEPGSDGWIDTGDLVEARDGRIYFCGRAGNMMINVGGQKAFPPDIEAHLMAHPQVVWAQVTARRAPMVGNLPAASVVLRQPMEVEAAEIMLTRHCEGRLADYAIPRLWDFLESIPLRSSLKS